jgi:hypothetical protein
MAICACVIIGIVSWCYFSSTCSEPNFHHIISNNFHISVWDEWMNNLFAYELLKSYIVWVDGNSNIAQHGLNSGCGDYYFVSLF